MQGLLEQTSQFFKNPTEYIGSQIIIVGRITQIRALSKTLRFFMLKSPFGTVQCTIPNPELILPNRESIAKVIGSAQENDVRSGIPGIEIIIDKIDILNAVETVPPILDEHTSRAFRIENRHLDLRNVKTAAIFKVKSALLISIRQFLLRNDFLEITSPKIVGESIEGPIGAFSVDYFDNKAYLSLSNMLYHMVVIAGDLPKIFEIGPCFRATKSNTNIHTNEFTVLDYSAAYLNREEIMELTVKLIISVIDYIKENCAEELNLLKCDLSDLSEFEIITYQELLNYLKTRGFDLPWGATTTVPKTAIPLLSEKFKGFFWIIDQPEESKAFYSKARNVDGHSVCLDFQLWHPRITDIVDGAERVIDLNQLVAKMKERNLDPGRFNFYLNALRHGLPPMTGAGLGIDRLLQLILGLSNIREAILFPRDSHTRLF